VEWIIEATAVQEQHASTVARQTLRQLHAQQDVPT